MEEVCLGTRRDIFVWGKSKERDSEFNLTSYSPEILGWTSLGF